MHPRVKYWYDKFIAMGLESEEAELMATLKYEIDKDRSILDWLKAEGLSGLKSWAQTNCPRLYKFCEKVWGCFKRTFGV